MLFRLAADTEPAAEGPGRPVRARATDAGRCRPSPGCPGRRRQIRRTHRWMSSSVATVPWVQVYDGRPESVLRRTPARPTDKLARAKILLLGCGGLGAPIAEHCVRSGAARLHIVDSGTVSPGVLSRQPYEDADIGKPRPWYWPTGSAGSARKAKSPASVVDISASDLFSESELGRVRPGHRRDREPVGGGENRAGSARPARSVADADHGRDQPAGNARRGRRDPAGRRRGRHRSAAPTGAEDLHEHRSGRRLRGVLSAAKPRS